MNTKEIIVATDKDHLKQLIKEQILLNGNQCDLNHINVSHITDMSWLFSYSQFNGDISQWNIKNVETIDEIFEDSNNPNIPYWANFETQEERIIAYDNYLLQQQLINDLPQKNNNSDKKLKL